MRTVYFGWIAAALAAMGCAGMLSAGVCAAAEPAPESMMAAIAYCEFLATDANIEARYKSKVALACAEAGLWDEAFVLASKISLAEWRRPWVVAELGVLACAMGEKDRAVAALVEAGRELPLHGGWRRTRIEEAMVELLAELGRFEEACAKFEQLPEEAVGRMVAGQRLIAGSVWSGRVKEAVDAVRKLPPVTDAWVREAVARAYLNAGRAARKAGRAEEAAKYFGLARAEVGDTAVLKGPADQLEMAQQFLAGGDREQARATALAAAEAARALPDGSDSKAVSLVNAAVALRDAGEQSRAEALLSDAQRQPPLLRAIDRTPSQAAVAMGFEALGNTAAATSNWVAAAGIVVNEVTHHRVRAMGVIDICLALAEAGRPLDSDLKSRLDQTRPFIDRELADWVAQFGPIQRPPTREARRASEPPK